MRKVSYTETFFNGLRTSPAPIIEQVNKKYPEETKCLFLAWTGAVLGSTKDTVAIFKVKKKGGDA